MNSVDKEKPSSQKRITVVGGGAGYMSKYRDGSHELASFLYGSSLPEATAALEAVREAEELELRSHLARSDLLHAVASCSRRGVM